jgi:phospholipase C
VGDDEKSESERKASRRAFLKTSAAAGLGGFAAGGAVVAGINGAVDAARPSGPFDPLEARSEPGFDHVVVLMFENRSFDNILGYLYTNDELQTGDTFDGLNQGSYSNLAPDGTQVDAHVYLGDTDEVMRHPQPDPGEHYPHVNTQVFGIIDPPGNADLWEHEFEAPFNAPANGATPDMSGFVTDYIVNYKALKKGQEPTFDDYRVAMGSFSTQMLPVFSAIAKGFAVYDAWHAGVPSQTFCNRSFFHASTSHGFVTNKDHGGYDKWIDAPAATTVFNRLQDAGLSWRVYYDEQQLVSFTGMLHAAVLEPYWKSNFRGMAQFHEDAKNGTLPDYAFIEPRMVFNHNDMHPPYGTLREGEYEGEKVYDSALSDVRAGEALLHTVYTSLKNAKSATGSNALNTAFLVTFDEHGGTFDHVPARRRAKWSSSSTASDVACPRSSFPRTPLPGRSSTTKCITAPSSQPSTGCTVSPRSHVATRPRTPCSTPSTSRRPVSRSSGRRPTRSTCRQTRRTCPRRTRSTRPAR